MADGMGRKAAKQLRSGWIARVAAGMVAAALLAGCTNFTGKRFDLSSNPADRPAGLYVFDEVPLLVVASGQISVVMVKSADRGTAIQFNAFLAKHDVSLEFFSTGGLSKVTSNQDATALPLKIVEVVKSVIDELPAGVGLSGSAAGSFQVYSITFDNGRITGLTPLITGDAADFVAFAPVTGDWLGDVGGTAAPACDSTKLKPGETCPGVVSKK